ncbi:translocation/assembly module TamB domain-containing protein [Actimicrobium antarcticum]|uniref:Translocation/assembly module TamB domain-containing protein n=1 Tax=Actimicrobium antarcticum TaxID=1051899 RepID=A0ABP7U108_9BURK
MASDPAPVPVHLKRWQLVLMLVAGLLSLLVVLVGALVGTEIGARLLLTQLLQVPGLQIEGVQGRLLGPLRIARVRHDGLGQTVTLNDLRLDWQPRALLNGRLHVNRLRLASIDITSKIDRPDEPVMLPARIALPFDLQMDQVQVDGGELRKGPVSLVRLGGFGFKLDFDGARYLLQLDRLDARVGTGASENTSALSGNFSGQATLSAISPYALQARISSGAQATLDQHVIGASGRVDLSGSLAELVAALDLTINQARVTGETVLRPFSDKPLGRTTLLAKALDLSALQSTLPTTSLDIALLAADVGSGQLTVRNVQAGTLDAARLPLRDLLIDFTQQDGRITFGKIDLALGSDQLPAGSLRGDGTFAQGALTLALVVDKLNGQRLDKRINPTSLSGNVGVLSAGGKQELTIDLSEPAGRNTLRLSAHATVADAALAIDRAQLQLADGRLSATGELALAGTQAFRVTGKASRMRLQDLGQFAQMPALELTGDFTLSGARAPQLSADLVFRLVDSVVAGRPLRGEGEARLRADVLKVPNLLLVAGDNRLTVQGELADAGSALAFTLEAPKLDQLGPLFGGALTASGTLRGKIRNPDLTAQWQATNLRLPGALQVASLQGKAALRINPEQAFSLDQAVIDATASGVNTATQKLAGLTAHVEFATRADAPLAIAIDATGIDATGLRADKVSITANGTTGQHALSASMIDPAQTLRVTARGGLKSLRPDARWQGSVDSLEGSGQYVVKLLAPAALSLSQEKVTLDNFRLKVQGTTLTVEQFLRDATGIVTRGRFTQLEVASLLALQQPAPPIASDLQLGGEWNLTIAEAISGSVRVRREMGDLTMRGNAPVALGLSQLDAVIDAVDGRLSARLKVEGKQLGHIDVSGSAVAGRGAERYTLPANSPLKATATIAIPSLNWAGPIITAAMVTEGSLQSDIAISGTIAQPRFGGRITGSDLRVFLSDQGIDLRKGVLDSTFEGERLVVRKLRFESGGGTLNATGPINLTAGLPEAQISLKADQFPVFNRSDRKLVLSGTSEIGWRDQRASVTGAFKVDSGSFDLGRADAPALSDDVVIVGSTRKSGQRVAAAIDVSIDLGQGVALRGRGLDALLTGDMRILASGNEALRGQGTLNIAQGTYSAYGRKLAIEQGVLRFNGPLNNPSLDIVAMRRSTVGANVDVEAGVAVRGTVLVPRVTLVSEPTVSDADKLSWLVLGRPLASAGSGDAGALQAAASSLLSQGAAAGVQSQLASAFGLENFSVGKSSDSLQQRIVTVGKQISARLYVSYEQGLESANSVLHFRYTLTPKLTLEAEAGARSAVSLFYNVLFD